MARFAPMSNFLQDRNTMRIALFQLDAHEVEACASVDFPIERIVQLLSMAEEERADLAVFPRDFHS